MILGAALVTAQARADDDDQPRAGASAEAAGDDDAVDTESIFGFTEGADTGEAGEKEVSFDFVARASRLAEGGKGRYRAFSADAEFEYSVTDDLKLSLSGALDGHHVRNIADAEYVSRIGFNGLGAELKYRLLNRRTSPIGLAFAVEPQWSRYEDGSGERSNSYGLEIRAQADAEIAPDRLFVAANLTYEPEWARGRDEDEDTGEIRSKLEKESSLELSAAITGRIASNAFLGFEGRFLQSFEGVAFERREGRAFYLGPTLYVQLTENAYVKAAWSHQLAGKSQAFPGGRLDLVDYDRNQFRLNVGYEF